MRVLELRKETLHRFRRKHPKALRPRQQGRWTRLLEKNGSGLSASLDLSIRRLELWNKNERNSFQLIYVKEKRFSGENDHERTV